MDLIFPLLGIVLILAGLAQFGLWTAAGIRHARHDRKKFDAELQKLRAEIFQITSGSGSPAVSASSTELASPDVGRWEQASHRQPPAAPDSASWVGFRRFQVTKLVSETFECTSIYLRPADGKPLAPFRPGQHLTLRFSIPGISQPVIRCYTLSDAPGQSTYRITVKKIGREAGTTSSPGLISGFVNQHLQVGEFVEAKIPGGNFHLVDGQRPIVLLAGGVGITPMMSILSHLIQTGDDRRVLLVYGVRNSQEHIFKTRLSEIAESNPSVHVINCYSRPLDSDQANLDFQVRGFVSTDVLKKLLPGNNFDYYLCGPPAFMESLYQGLLDWEVPRDQIRFEAFGPSSIKRIKDQAGDSVAKTEGKIQKPITIHLITTGKVIEWFGEQDNLLDLLESSNVAIDSGCRSGSCGTCATRLLRGEVQHQDHLEQSCEAGWCLPCVAVPTTELELEI